MELDFLLVSFRKTYISSVSLKNCQKKSINKTYFGDFLYNFEKLFYFFIIIKYSLDCHFFNFYNLRAVNYPILNCISYLL